MEKVVKTGVLKTKSGWNVDLYEYLQIGDAVDKKLYSTFLELLFPAYFDDTLVQMGEPLDHKGGNGRARYMTIQKDGASWIFTGLRIARERAVIA